MPTYTFECKQCKTIYEELTVIDKTKKYPNVKCPECGSTSKERKIGLVSFSFKEPEGTKKWHNGSTGHDYRYKHKAPKVAENRQYAEKHSHVGPNPYGDAYNI